MNRQIDCILQVKDLHKEFDGKAALDSVSFDVVRGEFLSILGPSGCGKTTILRILIGLLTPDGGRIYLEGEDITSSPPDCRGMGIVFQNYALFENMTVLKNIEYALRIKRATKATARQSALDMLERMGMREYAARRPGELSGGQQQRVDITHDQEEAFAMSDRIMVMDNAKLVQLGTQEDILRHPANDYVREFVINNLRIKIDSLVKYVDVGEERA